MDKNVNENSVNENSVNDESPNGESPDPAAGGVPLWLYDCGGDAFALVN